MEKPNSRLQVKNKAPAAVQITAEQLIREAKERELEVVPPPPKQKIIDPYELNEHKLIKRKEFEDNLRKNRLNVSHWLKYAAWEEQNLEIERVRSIFERALDNFGSKSIKVWSAYIETEMKNRQVKHARTLFDRAVHILPRVNQFWFKYVHFEEKLGNYAYCRRVFERWMKFSPGEQAWHTYINFELRNKEITRAREIHASFVMRHPDPANWIKFAKFEEHHSNPSNARQIYETAFKFFGDDFLDEKLFIAFAQFEERQQEHDRVEAIYEFALEKLPKERVPELYNHYANFQKRHGSQTAVEKLIAQKWRLKYEEKLAENRYDYDTWFDYLRLAEDMEFPIDDVREIYERAIASVPQDRKNKNSWRRYIYLWIYYATFEELTAEDRDRAAKVYELCLYPQSSNVTLIPHKVFTFAKVWIFAAKLQIRAGNIDKAREILSDSIRICPKRKLFRQYIEFEMELRDINNCRALYEKFRRQFSWDSSVYIGWAQLEEALQERARVRAIYENAIKISQLDSPEAIWKAYIEFETECEEHENVKELYERLRNRTDHRTEEIPLCDKERSGLMDRVKRWKNQKEETGAAQS